MYRTAVLSPRLPFASARDSLFKSRASAALAFVCATYQGVCTPYGYFWTNGPILVETADDRTRFWPKTRSPPMAFDIYSVRIAVACQFPSLRFDRPSGLR